jgi:pimeloyl-ACP methyl ester carboxylesterase
MDVGLFGVAPPSAQPAFSQRNIESIAFGSPSESRLRSGIGSAPTLSVISGRAHGRTTARIATHADELARFITMLNAGPVHLVTRSRDGGVAMVAALKNHTLVRTLTLHEPGAVGKAAREDRSKFTSAAIAADKAGDRSDHPDIHRGGVSTRAGRIRPPSGGDAENVAQQRANRPAAVRRCAPAGHHVRCTEDLHRPTLVTHGEKTHAYYKLINEGISKCVSGLSR